MISKADLPPLNLFTPTTSSWNYYNFGRKYTEIQPVVPSTLKFMSLGQF